MIPILVERPSVTLVAIGLYPLETTRRTQPTGIKGIPNVSARTRPTRTGQRFPRTNRAIDLLTTVRLFFINEFVFFINRGLAKRAKYVRRLYEYGYVRQRPWQIAFCQYHSRTPLLHHPPLDSIPFCLVQFQ